MVGFDFTQSVGFTNPVDNPVSLARGSFFLDSWLVVPPMDVRAYNSVVVNWTVFDLLALGVWDDYFLIEVRGFETEADALADSNPLYDESIFVYSDNMSGAGGYPVTLFAPVFAPWYTMSSLDISFRDSYQIDYRMMGSFRIMPNTVMRMPSGASNGGTVLLAEYFDLAGAGSDTSACTMGYGRARIRIHSTLSNARVRVIDPISWVLIEVTTVAGAFAYGEFIATKNQMYCEVTNTGGVLSRIDVSVTLEEQAF